MVNAGAKKHSVDCRLLLDAFLLSKFGPRWLIGKLWKSNFHKNLNFFIWNQFCCSKYDFPITGQKDKSCLFCFFGDNFNTEIQTLNNVRMTYRPFSSTLSIFDVDIHYVNPTSKLLKNLKTALFLKG